MTRPELFVIPSLTEVKTFKFPASNDCDFIVDDHYENQNYLSGGQIERKVLLLKSEKEKKKL